MRIHHLIIIRADTQIALRQIVAHMCAQALRQLVTLRSAHI